MILFPKIIQIETNLVCNSHCVFCPHNEMQREPRYMDDAVWKKIVDESRNRGVIYRPFMVNEPLTEKRMPQIINYIKQDSTAKVELNSNGNYPPNADIKAILNQGLDFIRFSIDGFREETFKKSGRGGNFKKIVENVLRFVEERERQNSTCYIEVRMIDMNVTENEKHEFIDFWNKNADKGTVTSLYEWPWSGQTEPFAAPCPKIREEMYFMTNGNAVLCCWDAFGRGVVGNIKEQTVEEIWLSETNQKYRSWLNNGERDKILLCSRCDAFKNYDFSNWKGY